MKTAEPWTSKHKPLSMREIVGNENSVRRVFEWLNGWEKNRKAILLYGPPGVGKTASIEAISRDLGYNVLEMNASDIRTEDKINELILPALSSKALSGKKRLILFDEVDGIYGRSDSGGLKAILKIIDERTIPVAMTANDPWDENLRPLRSKVEMVEFRHVSAQEIAKRLREICILEGIDAKDDVLLKLAETCGGDVRSAIEDLQSASAGGKLSEEALHRIGTRLRQEKLFETLRGIFNATSVADAMWSLENSSEDYEEIFEWIYEYLPKAMKKNEDLVSALEYLGKADVILQRIKRTNDWSQLPYFLKLFTAGVALSNSSAEVSEIYYGERPDRLKNKWKYYNAWRRSESSSLILSRALHCSSQRVKADVLPLYKLAATSKGGEIFAKILQEIGIEL